MRRLSYIQEFRRDYMFIEQEIMQYTNPIGVQQNSINSLQFSSFLENISINFNVPLVKNGIKRMVK